MKAKNKRLVLTDLVLAWQQEPKPPAEGGSH
jgi:hypothetical protein